MSAAMPTLESRPVRAPRLNSPRLLAALVVACILALVAPPAPSADAATSQVLAARNVVLSKLGDPYRYGAAGPNAFDCSGLIYYSYHRVGMTGMPRTAAAQASHTRRISKAALRPGDLMFFYGGGGVYHVAMFLGRSNGHIVMVDAPRTGETVHRHAPWTSQWFAGTMRGR